MIVYTPGKTILSYPIAYSASAWSLCGHGPPTSNWWWCAAPSAGRLRSPRGAGPGLSVWLRPSTARSHTNTCAPAVLQPLMLGYLEHIYGFTTYLPGAQLRPYAHAHVFLPSCTPPSTINGCLVRVVPGRASRFARASGPPSRASCSKSRLRRGQRWRRIARRHPAW